MSYCIRENNQVGDSPDWDVNIGGESTGDGARQYALGVKLKSGKVCNIRQMIRQNENFGTNLTNLQLLALELKRNVQLWGDNVDEETMLHEFFATHIGERARL